MVNSKKASSKPKSTPNISTKSKKTIREITAPETSTMPRTQKEEKILFETIRITVEEELLAHVEAIKQIIVCNFKNDK